jgi:hypothetical protein
VFIPMKIWQPPDLARLTGSKSKCVWNVWCARRNLIHLKISLLYNLPKIWVPAESTNHGGAQNGVERAAFTWYLQNGRIWFWSCHVHTGDLGLFMFSFASKTIEPTESRV